MSVRGIVAIDPRGAIGQNGTIPWHHPEDQRFFKRTTLGGVVVMGRRTYESIGHPLPGRANVVLSRTSRVTTEDTTIWTSDAGLPPTLAAERGKDLFVIGGAQIYRLYRDGIEEWIVTRIPDVAENADTFLDPELLAGFRVVRTESLTKYLRVEYLERA